jgi:hypothetical protein
MPPGQGYIVVMPDGQSIPVQSLEEIPPQVMQMIQSGQAQITDPQGNPVDPSQLAGGGGPPGGPGGPGPPGGPPGGPGGMQGPGGMPPGFMEMVAGLQQGQQQGNIQAPSVGPMQGPASGGAPPPMLGQDPLQQAMMGGAPPPHPSTMPPNLMQERLMPPGGPPGAPPLGPPGGPRMA